MRETKNKAKTGNSQILVDTLGLQEILSCGRPAAVRIGTDAHGRIQVGRRVLWDVKKIQQYISATSE